MAGLEKICINFFNENVNYSFRKLQVKKSIGPKNLDHVLHHEDDAVCAEMVHASNITVATFRGQALQVMQPVIGNPCTMLENLDTRFESYSHTSEMSEMREPVSFHHQSVTQNTASHINYINYLLLEQLKNIETVLDESMEVCIIIASIDTEYLLPVTVSIKTLAEDNVTWEDIAAGLIRETNSLKSNKVCIDSTNSAVYKCEIFSELCRCSETYFLNLTEPRKQFEFWRKKSSLAISIVIWMKSSSNVWWKTTSRTENPTLN